MFGTIVTGTEILVGTPMMRAGVAMFPRRTDRAGKDPQLSAGPVHGVRGRSRWLFEPDMSAGGAGDILAKAITVVNFDRNGDLGRVQNRLDDREQVY